MVLTCCRERYAGVVAGRKRQPISTSADALEYRRTVAVPPYEILIQRLKTIKQLILKTIDSAKPYGVAMSCVEYLDLLINRIETIRIQNDFSDQRSRSLRFSALWDVVQMARFWTQLIHAVTARTRQIPARKFRAVLSYRVAMARQSLSLQKARSMRLRFL